MAPASPPPQGFCWSSNSIISARWAVSPPSLPSGKPGRDVERSGGLSRSATVLGSGGIRVSAPLCRARGDLQGRKRDRGLGPALGSRGPWDYLRRSARRVRPSRGPRTAVSAEGVRPSTKAAAVPGLRRKSATRVDRVPGDGRLPHARVRGGPVCSTTSPSGGMYGMRDYCLSRDAACEGHQA
jgi:hypothetical protein